MADGDVNLGASKLRDSGRSAAEIAAFLAGRGVEITRMTASNYRRGRTVPPENVRAVLVDAPFYIPTDAWDRPIAPSQAPEVDAATVPATDVGGRADDPPATRGDRSSATLAAELLTRIEGWRAQAEREGTPAAAARFAALEGRAIERLAKLRGEATAPEGELVRSPQWARLRAQILDVVAYHPETARRLLAVLEASGHSSATKGP